jgi:hypothetical protein
MTDLRDKPSGRPTNADTDTPLPPPSADPEVPPLREDYGGPRTTSGGERVRPDTSEAPADVTPLPSGDGLPPGDTHENFNAPAHSKAGEGDEAHRAGRSPAGDKSGWEPTSRPEARDNDR